MTVENPPFSVPHSHRGNVVVQSVEDNTVLSTRGGGDTATILNGIGNGAAVVASSIKIIGDVANDAYIMADGGNARVTVFGNVADGAHIMADGGGACVTVFGWVADDYSLHTRTQRIIPNFTPRFIMRLVRYFYRKRQAAVTL